MSFRPSGRVRGAALLLTTLGLLGPMVGAASAGTIQAAVEVGQVVTAGQDGSGHNWV